MPEFYEEKPGGFVTFFTDAMALKTIHVMIATPMDGGISPNFVVCLSKLLNHFERRGIRYNFQIVPNDSLITRARNTLTALFLSHPLYTHMMWIDSDLSFDPVKVELLLMAHKEVSGAAYPLKTSNFEMMTRAANASETLTVDELKNYSSKFVLNTVTEDMLRKAMRCDDPTGVYDPSKVRIVEGFTEVSELGTGFLCVRRSAYLKMIKKYAKDYYSTDQPTMRDMDRNLASRGIHVFYTFYDTMVFETKGEDGDEDDVTRRYLSEDYAFCQKWRMMGGTVYCLVDVTFTHTGPVEFCGNYYHHLLQQQKLVELEQRKEAQRQQALLASIASTMRPA